MGPDALARVTGVALSLQLVLAAGAVAGPWAVVADAPPPRPVPATAPAPGADTVLVRPVALSAPALWTGEALVYRPVTSSELWLITCGGRFDPRSGHYEDNVVVRAVRI